MVLIEVRHHGLSNNEEVEIFTRALYVFLRMATGDFFMRGPNSWDFFPTSERVEHLLSVWAGAGYPDILSNRLIGVLC